MVGSNKQRRKGPITAVEIDGRFLRILQVHSRGAGAGVRRWASAELARPPMPDDQSAIREAGLILRGLLAKNRFSCSHIVLVLPRNLAVTKELRLPSHREKELCVMAQNELMGQESSDQEDLAWDIVVKELLSEGYARVEVTQIREKDISQFLGVLASARVRPSGLVLSSEALSGLCSLLKAEERGAAGVVLRASASGIDVLSCAEGERLARRIPLVDGEDSAGRLRELDLTLSTLRGRGGESSAASTGLLTATGTTIDVEEAPSLAASGKVKRLSWQDLNGLAPQGIEESSLGDFALCLGAAARVLSADPLPYLLPRRVLREKARKRGRRWRAMLVIVCLTNLGLIATAFWQDRTCCRQELDALKREIDRVAPVVASLETKREVLRATKAMVQGRTAPLDFLYVIHALTPQAISLSAASLSTDKFVIRGEAPKLSQVFEYVGILQKTPGFSAVEVQETGMRRRGEKEVAEFSLRGAFSNQEAPQTDEVAKP